jgi:hypothetical protein
VRKTKTRDQGGTESFGTGGGGDGRKRNGFSPTGCPVHDGEDMGVALGGREWANKVNVNVGKTTGWNRNGCGRWGNMGVCFGSLARNALLGPEVDILRHTMPEESGSDKAARGPNPWMAKGMDMEENGLAERKRNEGPEGGVEMSPSKDRLGERGMDEMRREGSCLNCGMEGQVCCSWAMDS